MEYTVSPTATNMDDKNHQKPPQPTHNAVKISSYSLQNKTPTLVTLPEELLLCIIDEFPQLPRHRRNALLSLPQTCRYLRRITLKMLWTQLVVHIYNVHALVRAYLTNPELAEITKSIEIVTHVREGYVNKQRSERSHRRALARFAPDLDEPFREACIRIIEGTSISAQGKQDCIFDLGHDYPNAFTCVLLSMLPTLSCLLLGTGEISHFPFLKALSERDYFRDHPDNLLLMGTFIPSRSICLRRTETSLTRTSSGMV
jgi:hypothetical protein